MKVTLLVLLGLVAMAMSQESGEFVVLEEKSREDDMDPDDVQKLEDENTAARYLHMLQKADSIASLEDSSISDAPPGYKAAMKGRLAMFDVRNARNEQVHVSRKARVTFTNGTQTSLYHCPHRTHLLRWSPQYCGFTLTDICFVPWASRQAITYARCTQPRCRLTSPRLGRCRPSCYQRRRILVVCFNLQQQQSKRFKWRWRWVVRGLPQACLCATC